MGSNPTPANFLMTKMHERYKKDRVAKKLNSIIKKFKNGIVIVEGKHDIETLNKLGIKAITFNHFVSISRKNAEIKSDVTFYIFMDLDKGGYDKRDKTIDIIITQSNAKYNTVLGRRFLQFLNVTSVEQIYQQYLHLTNQEDISYKYYNKHDKKPQ